MSKVALITGVTGQDGAYLAEFLLKKGYIVHGIKRRSSLFNTERVDHLYQDPHESNVNFRLHYGDLTDAMNVTRLIKEIEPDEIYNLASMSHVKVSFEIPEYTADVNALGALRILEAVRLLGLSDKTRVYQASTSELYGDTKVVPQNEQTPFQPVSPYSVAKMYAYWIMVNYRQSYGIFACNGILFNHESPVRGETFVTRKITRAVARMALGLQDKVYLGNLDAKRDWGHTKDYVEAMWLMLQQKEAEDFVIATGKTTSVRDFAKMAFEEVGVELTFENSGEKETAMVAKSSHSEFKFREGQEVIAIDKEYYRPTELTELRGDATKAKNKLGWQPKTELKALVREMVRADIEVARKEMLHQKEAGFKGYFSNGNE